MRIMPERKLREVTGLWDGFERRGVIFIVGEKRYKLLCGDAIEVLQTLPDQSCHVCVTSPPYW